jgi:hypothetical protein
MVAAPQRWPRPAAGAGEEANHRCGSRTARVRLHELNRSYDYGDGNEVVKVLAV